MKQSLTLFLVLILGHFLPNAYAVDNGDIQTRIERAVGALNDLTSVKETSIPGDLMKAAKCIANLRIVKIGFGFGGKGGSGVASCRNANGIWSAPIFLTLGGLSYGFQIGVERIDLTLVFTNRDAEQSLVSENFTLGASGGLTAGPEGRDASAGTNYKLEDTIYSYSRSKGLYAGISLEGAMLVNDNDYNYFVYAGKSAREILNMDAATIPNSVSAYVNALNTLTK